MKPDQQADLPERTPDSTSTAPQTSPRDATFDILKGIGILEVMLHHVLGFSARKYATAGDVEWWVMSVAHQALHFAVPTFLLVSALLLARSLASRSKPDWKRFYARRTERTLWPYIVWSLLYLFFRLWIVKAGDDLYPTQVSLPLGNDFTLPAILADGTAWRSYFFWGKAYFHLYFLAVLLQFSCLFPLFYLALRRMRLAFGGVLLIAALLQLLFFYLHVRIFYPIFHFTTPASSILSYLLPVLIGAWLGLNWEQWPQVWRRWRWPLLGATLLGFGIYMTLSVRQLQDEQIGGLTFNAAYAVYAAGTSLLLLAGAQFLARGSRVGGMLARIGNWSLPLFLIHPLFFFFFSGPRIGRVIDALPLSAVWVFTVLFVLTWGASALTGKLHIDRLLFGRSLSPTSKGQE